MKITREEIRQSSLFKAWTRDMGHEPLWINEDYYAEKWEWITSARRGSFSQYLQEVRREAEKESKKKKKKKVFGGLFG